MSLKNLTIDGERLWQSLMAMAEIGPGVAGGNRRLALTDLDKQGRDLFIGWCREAGLAVSVDQMGNIFARREGTDPDKAPIATGSHLDTQPTGGRFDGVFGVLAGLEVIRTLNDHGIETAAPLELAVWTNEEGARFAPAMIGSGVFAGKFELDYAHARVDTDGKSLGEELRRIGYLGEAVPGEHRLGAFFEAHIEQGPILEAEGKTIGVVTGAQGQRWFDVRFAGLESHAGTTPMARRRDALAGAARLVVAVREIAERNAPAAVGTVGMIEARPNSRNTIPGHVFLTVDLRHPVDEVLAAMAEEMQEAARTIATADELTLDIEPVAYTPPVVFDAACVQAVREAADQAGYPRRDIISGAGHDACYIAAVAPTAMIFVPCADGLSHNEAESATPEDLAAGCNVLLHAILGRASA